MKLGGTTTVICALGQRPRWNVAQELCDCAPRVRVIGDANAVGTITKATALRWISDRVFYQTGALRCRSAAAPLSRIPERPRRGLPAEVSLHPRRTISGDLLALF